MLDETNENAGITGTAPETATNTGTEQTPPPVETNADESKSEPNPNAEPPKGGKEDKTFKQDEVNTMIGERVNREKAGFCKKLGIDKYEDVEAYVAKNAENSTKLAEIGEKYGELSKKVAFLENNIDEKRYEDVAIYFKGKGLELNSEELAKEIAAHPEWVKATPTPNVTTITSTSPKSGTPPIETEDERKDREFGKIQY